MKGEYCSLMWAKVEFQQSLVMHGHLSEVESCSTRVNKSPEL